MADPQGLVIFPGVQWPLDGSISLTHGTTPSIAILTCLPQPNWAPAVGRLTFVFAGRFFHFPDCKVDRVEFLQTTRGQFWRVLLLDRRWKWAFGEISGQYNVRQANGLVRESTEKTPQELAVLCLQAMGESGYSVGDLPNETRPEIDWDGVRPAAALGDLCDSLGCRVVLQLDNRVAIRRAGMGNELPLDGAMSNSFAPDLPELPDAIGIRCGPSEWQADLELEAVGDTGSGEVAPINSLWYKPTGGWGSVVDGPNAFIAVSANDDWGEETAARQLARASVFRWYRPKLPVIIGGGQVMSYDCLDVLDRLVDLDTDDLGEKITRPAIVHGIWYRNAVERAAELRNSAVALLSDPVSPVAAYSRLYRGWTLDNSRATDPNVGPIIKFAEPVYRNTQTGATPTSLTVGPAVLRFRTTIRLRDPTTRGWIRYGRSIRTGARNGTNTLWLDHPEIVAKTIINYITQGSEGLSPGGYTTNEQQANAECDYYLRAAEQDFALRSPQTVKYMGLRAIELDGAIEHLTLDVGPAGAITTAARHNEIITRTIPYRERRRMERQREIAARKAEIDRVIQGKV